MLTMRWRSSQRRVCLALMQSSRRSGSTGSLRRFSSISPSIVNVVKSAASSSTSMAMASSSSSPPSWKPGQPVVFASSRSGNAGGSSGRGGAMARSALAPVSSVQASSVNGTASALTREKQPVVKQLGADWSAAGWNPGMAINIASKPDVIATAASANATRRAKAGKQAASKPTKRDAPAKSSDGSSQSSLETYWSRAPAKKKPSKESGCPTESVNTRTAGTSRVSQASSYRKQRARDCIVIEDESFDSARASLGDRSEPSTANATLDPEDASDASVILLAEKPNPLSSALRHIALAQLHVTEAIAQRDDAEATARAASAILSSSNTISSLRPFLPIASSSTFTEASRQRARDARTKALSPRRSFCTSSAVSESVPFDWDDPVVQAANASITSDGSDLPEIVFPVRNFGPVKKPATVDVSRSDVKGKGKRQEDLTPRESALLSRKPLAPTVPAQATVRPTSNKTTATAPKQNVAWKKEGQKLLAGRRGQKQADKDEQEAELKRKFPLFSYDSGRYQIVPNIWYFEGPDAKLVGCDTRSGTPQVKTLEEVVSDLRGPLGFDLEWNAIDWNDNYTAKNAQGKTALFQLGDQRNIVLYQLAGSKRLPPCLQAVIEDRNVLKLGVCIKGDGNKLLRDFNGICPKGFLEISDMAKHVDPEKYAGISHLIALQRLVGDWLEAYLDKGDARTSKWDTVPLRRDQKKYAANDVFCAVHLYRRLYGYAEAAERSLDFASCIHDYHTGQEGSGFWSSRAPFVPLSAAAAAGGVHGSPSSRVVPGSLWRHPTRVQPRKLEAWEQWHLLEEERDAIAASMKIKPFSVVGYIIDALSIDEGLPFDAQRLMTLTASANLQRSHMAALDVLLSKGSRSEAGEHPDDATEKA